MPTLRRHIHKAQAVNDQETVRYAGSPIPLSFSERDYQRSVTLLNIDEGGNTEVSTLDYTPLCVLLTLPQYGYASPEKLLSLLAELPEDDGTQARETWPFLELRVEISQPEPELRAQIVQQLSNKAVRFCRVATNLAHSGERKVEDLPSLANNLEQISPLDLAQRHYQERFDNEMPDALLQRFKMAEQLLHEA